MTGARITPIPPLSAGCAVSGDTIECYLYESSNEPYGELEALTLNSSYAPESPFDVTIFGIGAAGNAFCCHYDDDAGAITTLEVSGTSGEDRISFTHDDLGAELNLPFSLVYLYGDGDMFRGSRLVADTAHGGDGGDILGGRGGGDTLYGENGADRLHDGEGADVLIGGGATDILVSADDPANQDEMRGGTAADYLCSTSGVDLLIANETPTFTIDRLYVAPNLVVPPCSSGSLANSTGARCGHRDDWSSICNPAPWMGSCDYSLTSILNYYITAAP